jgi:hypothetical protein
LPVLLFRRRRRRRVVQFIPLGIIDARHARLFLWKYERSKRVINNPLFERRILRREEEKEEEDKRNNTIR